MRAPLRRAIAVATAAVLLTANAGRGVDARQDEAAAARMGPQEEAGLASRAAVSTHLETFEGGGLEGLAFAAIYGSIITAIVAVGLLVGCPLGLSHATSGQTFMPKEAWRKEGADGFVTRSGLIFGFPLYCLGYVSGLGFRSLVPAPAPPEATTIEAWGLTVGREEPERPGVAVAAVRGPAEASGVRAGDRLLDVDGRPVTYDTLEAAFPPASPPREIEVTLLRGETRIPVKIARADD